MELEACPMIHGISVPKFRSHCSGYDVRSLERAAGKVEWKDLTHSNLHLMLGFFGLEV
jgi:hypothetical protein